MEIGANLVRPRSIALMDATQPGEARRIASAMATELEFTDVQRGKLEIVVTELARNVVIHGGGGHLHLTPWKFGDQCCVDVVAWDKGPGIKDVARSLEDGYSTAGTSGTGMGAVARISKRFEVYTQPDRGTAVFAQVKGKKGTFEVPFDVGAISVALASERACGDSSAVHFSAHRTVFLVVDGLGHGPIAQEAADEAVQAFHNCLDCTPVEMIEFIHDALKATRGAAVAIAEIQNDRGVLQYAGVGNIAGVILSDGKARSMVSHNGTVGHLLGRRNEFSYPWEEDSLLVMHSDGLQSKWNLDSYPGLQMKHPALIAGIMVRDLSRGRDDATALVARRPHAS